MKTTKNITAFLIILLILALSITGCGGNNAKQEEGDKAIEFPKKPVEIIVPFAAGGAVDTTIRFLTSASEDALGSSFVVVNKPGGGAVIGQTEVANAEPDGYKLLAATSSLVTNTIQKDTSFTIDDFEPVIMYCFDPEILVVSADSNINSIQDLIEEGKKRKLIQSTSGHSTSHHVASLIFTNMTGTEFEYVHTDGGAKQILQIAGGHAEVGMGAYAPFASMIEQGKVRVIGVASENRVPYMKDVPTFKEQGVDLIYGAWRGIAAPKGTPEEVIKLLHDAFKVGMDSDDFTKKMQDAGYPMEYQDYKGFKNYIQNDYDKVKEIIDSIGK